LMSGRKLTGPTAKLSGVQPDPAALRFGLNGPGDFSDMPDQEWELDVACGAPDGHERSILEDHPHVTHGRWQRSDVDTIDLDSTGPGSLKTGYDAEQTGLPTAGWTYERDQFAVLHGEIDALESLNTVGVSQRNSTQPDPRHKTTLIGDSACNRGRSATPGALGFGFTPTQLRSAQLRYRPPASRGDKLSTAAQGSTESGGPGDPGRRRPR